MYVLAHGVRTHVVVEGEGDPVLLVHGWGGSMQSLQRLATHLRKAERVQTILVDLPGFGASDAPPSTWGTPDYAQALLDVCKSLDHSSVIYFGHSFGGALGIYLAAQHKTHIQRLILCNSSFKRTKPRSRMLALKHILSPAARILPQQLRQSIRLALYRLFFPHSDISRYPHLEQVFKTIVSYDLTPLVTSISAPTLIVWGEEDHITPLLWGQELHDTIDGSTLVIIAQERHGLPLRSPDKLITPISQFLHS